MVPVGRIARDWRLYAAAGVAALILGGAKETQAGPQSPKEQPQSDKSQRQPPAPPVAPFSPSAGRAKPPCEHGGNPDTADPNCREAVAAEESAKFAKWSFRVSVFAVLAAIGQIVALIVTIRQTRAAVGASQRSAKAAEDAVAKSDEILSHSRDSAQSELRAYVFVHRTELELTPKGTGVGTTGHPYKMPRHPTGRVSFTYENTGQTPAKNVRVAARAVWMRASEPVDITDVGPLRLIGPLGPSSVFDEDLKIENGPLNAAFIRDAIDSHANEVHLFGRIEYDTAFETGCWTTFHCWLGPTTGYDRVLHAVEPGNDYR